jgi:hypothetical protein
MNFREVVGFALHGTGSKSCPLAGFDVHDVEPPGSVTTVSRLR